MHKSLYISVIISIGSIQIKMAITDQIASVETYTPVATEAEAVDVNTYLAKVLGDVVVASWDSENVDVERRLGERLEVVGGLLRVNVKVVNNEGLDTYQIDFDDSHRHFDRFEDISAEFREDVLMPMLGKPAVKKDISISEHQNKSRHTTGWLLDRAKLTILSDKYQHQYLRKVA